MSEYFYASHCYSSYTGNRCLLQPVSAEERYACMMTALSFLSDSRKTPQALLSRLIYKTLKQGVVEPARIRPFQTLVPQYRRDGSLRCYSYMSLRDDGSIEHCSKPIQEH